jgi:hypothetical protein
LAKVTKTAPARHEPVRWSRTGPPRSSRRTARRPNSLRSNRGASSAARHCGARLALRRDVLTATATANGNSKSSSDSERLEAGGKAALAWRARFGCSLLPSGPWPPFRGKVPRRGG